MNQQSLHPAYLASGLSQALGQDARVPGGVIWVKENFDSLTYTVKLKGPAGTVNISVSQEMIESAPNLLTAYHRIVDDLVKLYKTLDCPPAFRLVQVDGMLVPTALVEQVELDIWSGNNPGEDWKYKNQFLTMDDIDKMQSDAAAHQEKVMKYAALYGMSPETIVLDNPKLEKKHLAPKPEPYKHPFSKFFY